MTLVGNLIALDLAAAAAYGLAIDVCSTPDLKKQLRGFQSDHERHVRELSGWMSENGGTAPAELVEAGEIITGYTRLSSLEDRTALLAMRGNEEITNGTYASLLRAELPDDLRPIVERGFEDERRHIGWIREEIRIQGWDQEPRDARRAEGGVSCSP